MRWVLLGFVFAALFSLQPAAESQEYRGFWADGFNVGFHTAGQVDMLIARLQQAHCNAVWVQMRKSGDAYYRSTYEPWASDDPEHFDALQYLLNEAHCAHPGIEVHVWMNTCAVGRAASPGHIARTHPAYLSLSDTGQDYDNEATKIDPGNPGAADWTFRVYLDVVRHYDVDGIHFDFVRYGGAHWGYNPVSVARFNRMYGHAGLPAYNDLKFEQWRRAQVTELVRKVYAFTKELKPGVRVSAATIGWGQGPESEAQYRNSAPYSRVFQDWQAWMKEGILDINCPMFYFSNKVHRDFWLNWMRFAKDHKYGGQLVIGSGIWLNTIPDTLWQIADVRDPAPDGGKADGVLLYSYAGTNTDANGKEVQFNPELYRALGQSGTADLPAPFAQEASVPPLPDRGSIIKGFVVTAPWLAPVDGATVRLSGSGVSRSLRTDGTGFYAIMDVPDGDYTLEVLPLGASEPRTASISLDGASRVITRNVYIGSKSAVKPIGDSWIVTAGTDTLKDRVYVYNSSHNTGRRIEVRRLPLPFQPGDVVAVSDPAGASSPVVRWTDISRFGPPRPVQVPISRLADSGMVTGRPVSVTGIVKELLPDGFILGDGTGEVTVTTDALLHLDGITWHVGDRLRIVGVVDKETGLKLCPLSPDTILLTQKP